MADITAEIRTPTIQADVYRAAIIPEGYYKIEGTTEITENGTHNVGDYEFANVNVPERKEEQEKTVEITENGITEIFPDGNKVFSKATVNVNVPIPDGYIKPEGTLEIDKNGSYDVTEKAEVNVNTPPMQWQRPKDWLPYPEMSTEYDEIWMLVHISKDYGGAYIYEKGNYTVDWGDGVVEEKNITQAHQYAGKHCYNFEQLDESTETDLGYRQCWCRAYRERGSTTEFHIGWNYLNQTGELGEITAVEFIVNTSATSVIAEVYSIPHFPFLRHIKVVGDTVVLHGQLGNFYNLEYLEGNIEPNNGKSSPYYSAKIPYNKIVYSFSKKGVTSGKTFASACEAQEIEVDCENVTDLLQAFRQTKASKIVIKNTDSCSNFKQTLEFCQAKEVIGMSFSNATDISSMYSNFRGKCCDILKDLYGEKVLMANNTFQNCIAFNKIPDLIIPNCTSINGIFYSADTVIEVGLCDFSSVTSATDAFRNANYLARISFVEESIPISLNFSWSWYLDLDSIKSIIKGLKNYKGTDKEFVYTITFSAQTLSLLEEEGATAPDGGTWAQYAQNKGWNI